MSIPEAYGPDRFGLSFELFPPKTEAGEAALLRHVGKLMTFRPSYVTCTYGAGGSTQEKTLSIISRVRSEFGVPVATHLTCVGRAPDAIRDYLRQAVELDIQNVVALRGDPPKGEAEFRPVEGGYRYANELVEMISNDFPGLGVAVGGYPEVHLEAPSREADLENLKRKVDAGAHAVITQLFYDNEHFFRFRDDCDRHGINAPIVPGLLPISSAGQVKRITSLCGASLPAALIEKLDAAGEDTDAQAAVGIDFATQQTQELMDAGVPGIHYYVLNKSETTSQVLSSVGLMGPAGCGSAI